MEKNTLVPYIVEQTSRGERSYDIYMGYGDCQYREPEKPGAVWGRPVLVQLLPPETGGLRRLPHPGGGLV